MKIKNMALCGLFAALCAICAWISLPVGDVVFTLQTFAVFLGLFALGGQLGTIAFAVYLCLGAVGSPVFSGFQGGIGALTGVTGGYIWGLLLSCLAYWVLTSLGCKKWIAAAIAMAICYLCGTLWYSFVYADGSFWVVLLKCVVPYLLPDTMKIWLAHTLANRLKRVL